MKSSHDEAHSLLNSIWFFEHLKLKHVLYRLKCCEFKPTMVFYFYHAVLIIYCKLLVLYLELRAPTPTIGKHSFFKHVLVYLSYGCD